MRRRLRVRSRYGAGPIHLIALLASFALAGAAVVGFFERPGDVVGVLVWLGAAAVLHDLVLLPTYALIDRLTIGRLPPGLAPENSVTPLSALSPAPYIRIPAALSGLLLLVFFPVIFGLGRRAEFVASGIAEHGYLARWLLLTGVMFALSGAAFAVAIARCGRGPGDESDQRAVADERTGPAPELPR